MNVRDVTLAVLAGGAGSRMGLPKAHLKVRDVPILSWLLQQWEWEGPKLLITAPDREHPPGYEGFHREAVDAVADQGPMRGAITALDACETETTVIATCDMPLIQRHQLIWLTEQLAERPAISGVFIARERGNRTNIEPFPCALRKTALTLLQARLAAGDAAMHSLSAHPQFKLLAPPDDWPGETWLNLNHPKDLQALDRALGND